MKFNRTLIRYCLQRPRGPQGCRNWMRMTSSSSATHPKLGLRSYSGQFLEVDEKFSTSTNMRHENARIRESFHLEQIPHSTFTLFCVGTPDTPNIKSEGTIIVLVTRVVPSNPLQYNVYDTCTHNNRAITDSNYYHFSSLHKKASYCSTSLSIFFIYTHE